MTDLFTLFGPTGRGGFHRKSSGPQTQCGQGQALRFVRSRSKDDPSRPRRPAGDGTTERILALVAPPRSGSAADPRGTRDRPRSLQPSGQGLPHGEDRREYDVRQLRLPQHLPRFTPEARKANQALVDLLGKIAERKKATPAQIALAWLLAQKPWIVPIPGTTKLERLDENIGAVAVELTSDDLREIDSAAAKITVQGDSVPRKAGATDRTLNLGGQRPAAVIWLMFHCNAMS